MPATKKEIIFATFFIVSLYTVPSSCFLESFYRELPNAKLYMKDFLYTMKDGLQAVGKGIKFLENFIDSNIEEECVYECPSLDQMLVRNPQHKSNVNGCGSAGVFVDKNDLPKQEMVACCNGHDNCYDICGVDKEECDKNFKRCLYSTCDEDKANKLKYKKCQAGSKILYTAALALGCNFFKDAQKEACICVPKDKKGKAKEEL